TPRRSVKVIPQSPSASVTFDPAHPTSLVILAADTGPENARRLRVHARAGSTVLYVATRPGPGVTLATLLDAPPHPIAESPARDALISEITFAHPLFAPFAAPQYSDFTKIHFWKHRRLAAVASSDPGSPAGAGAGKQAPVGGGSGPRPELHVLARFDNGD